MAMKINLYTNNVSTNNGYNKVYARVENDEPMSIDKLAEHMAEHNTPYSKGAIKGILQDMVGCIRELALEGKPVKLDNLAIIKCQVKSTGANSYKDFSLVKHIKAVRLSAIATGGFSRAELKKKCNMQYTSLAEYLRNPEGAGTTGGDTGGDGGDVNNGGGDVNNG